MGYLRQDDLKPYLQFKKKALILSRCEQRSVAEGYVGIFYPDEPPTNPPRIPRAFYLKVVGHEP